MIKEAQMTNVGTVGLPAEAVLKLKSLRLELAESEPASEAVDKNVGGGVDRSTIPAEDFAGKNRSFPIVSPKDVRDAAMSMGRAGADNYPPEMLKKRIMAIAKRKGKPFMAMLPKAWASPKESAGPEDFTEDELSEAISYSDRESAVRAALKEKHGAAYIMLNDLFDDVAIYRVEMPTPVGMPSMDMPRRDGDRFYRCPWSITDDVVTVGLPAEVKRVVTYEPVAPTPPAPATEAGEELLGDWVELCEKAVAADGTFPVKLIQPGWGSSGFYSKELLQRDVPTAFPEGTHMYWNHATPGEEAQRPEGDLRSLAAVLVETPHFDDAGPAGPGMYAKGKAFGDYKAHIEELAPHIGVSIRAFGRGVKGEAEGKKGHVITELQAGRSVDFVTKPGAGGRVLELFESARSGAPPTPPDKETLDMADDKALQEAQTRATEAEAKLTEATTTIATLTAADTAKDAEIATLREHKLLGKAREVVQAALLTAKLPDVTKARLTEALLANPPVKDGALDEVAYAEAIKAAIDEAAAEVAAIAGNRVTGMGGSAQNGGKATLKESAKRRYLSEGKTEEEAEKLATLFANGR